MFLSFFQRGVQKVRTLVWWHLLLLSFLGGLLIEGVGCNYLYWLQFVQDYEKVAVLDSAMRYQNDGSASSSAKEQAQALTKAHSVSQNQGTGQFVFPNEPLNEGPLVLTSSQNVITLPLDLQKVRNVRVDVYHPDNPNMLLAGKIKAQTDTRKYLYYQVGNFVLSTKHQEANNIILPDRPFVKSLRLEFMIPENTGVYISAIIVNDELGLNFRPVRFFLWFVLICVPLLVYRYRLYAQICDLNKPAHRVLNWACLPVSVLLVLSILYINNTITGENLKSQCIFPQQCTFSYGSDSGSLLQDPPKTYEELYNSHIYVQQFDAWLKGQTYLDLKVDPRVSQMDDIYDMSEFYHNNVGWLFDHVIYKNRYYNYYGVSTLLVIFAPIYALTGQYPTIILALSIWAVLAVVMLHLAVSMWYRCFGYRANLLLFLLGQVTLPAIAMVYATQVALYTYMSAIATGAGIIACGYSAWFYKNYKRYIFAVLTGLFVVLLVLSRPHELFVALCFFIPLVWAAYQRFKYERALQPKDASDSKLITLLKILNIKALLCCGVVVLCGAIGVMYYNYVRFDSVFNFGQSLMVTAAQNVAKVYWPLDLANIIDALYNITWDTSATMAEYPYINFLDPSLNVKTYHTYPAQSSGLLSFNVNWILLLLFCGRKLEITSTQDEQPSSVKVINDAWWQRTLKSSAYYTMCVVVIFSIVLAVINILWSANLLCLYALETAWCIGLVSIFLVFEHIHWEQSKASKILYGVVVYALLSSWIFGYCWSLQGELARGFNPDLILQISNFLRPFLVTT